MGVFTMQLTHNVYVLVSDKLQKRESLPVQ